MLECEKVVVGPMVSIGRSSDLGLRDSVVQSAHQRWCTLPRIRFWVLQRNVQTI